jgi:hypothetical protein
VKSSDLPNNGQHEPLCIGLLTNLLRDIVAPSAPFRGMVKSQSEPTVTVRDKSMKYAFLLGIGNGQQRSGSFHQNAL